jgi:hypothetical protein
MADLLHVLGSGIGLQQRVVNCMCYLTCRLLLTGQKATVHEDEEELTLWDRKKHPILILKMWK